MGPEIQAAEEHSKLSALRYNLKKVTEIHISIFYLHVSGLSWLFVIPKYWGFSITGIFVMPIITASGPPSEDDGVLLPLEMWCRGLAESSSLLITEEGPKVRNKDSPVTWHSSPLPLIPPWHSLSYCRVPRVSNWDFSWTGLLPYFYWGRRSTKEITGWTVLPKCC